MKKLALLVLGALFSVNALAYDGIIHFRGAIVEDPCSVKTTTENATFKCYEINGKNNYTESTFSLESLKDGQKLPNNKGDVQIKEIKKNIKLITINYN